MDTMVTPLKLRLGGSYRIVLDGSSIEELIEAGHYTRVPEGLELNFDRQRPPESGQIELYGASRNWAVSEAETVLLQMGLLPPVMDHLLAFGAQALMEHDDFRHIVDRRQYFNIVFPAAARLDLDGPHRVASLHRNVDGPECVLSPRRELTPMCYSDVLIAGFRRD